MDAKKTNAAISAVCSSHRSRLRTAAKTNPARKDRKVTYPAVEVVEQALVRKGRLAKRWADGHYGTTTVTGYSALQRSYGYRGADADGIPGRTSLKRLAKDTGLGRESLYKALAPGAKPRYDTLLKLVHALGIKLSATPAHP